MHRAHFDLTLTTGGWFTFSGGGVHNFSWLLLCSLFSNWNTKTTADLACHSCPFLSCTHTSAHVLLLFLGRRPYGEVKQGAKRLRCEGHSSKSKYVSTKHPSLWVTADPNTQRWSGHSTPRHASVSLYTHIHLQASTFEHSSTMLMR